MVAARDAARAAKDYGESDRLRDELAAMGLEVMDTPRARGSRPHGLSPRGYSHDL